jgi:asparagine synthase (glutamine-hydrolysing)
VKAALALSFAPSYERPRRDALVRRARAAVSRLATTDARVVESDDGSLVVAELANDDVLEPEGGGFAILGARAVANLDGAPVTPRQLLPLASEAVRVPGAFDHVAPPFGALLRMGPNAPVVGVTDSRGLRHLSLWQGDGVAAVSTSALALAATVRAPIDEHAIGDWATSGFLLLDRTMWRGIRRLRPSEAVALRAGQVEISPPVTTEFPAPFRSRADAVDAGVAVLRGIVGEMVDAHPDCTLELSAGLDSRTVLAAVAPERRRGLRAFTLSSPGSVEEDVAAQLAALSGLDHHVVTREALYAETADQLAARAEIAAQQRDCYANPLAVAALDYAEDSLPQSPRLNGQAAEFAQGRFYPAIPGRALERLPARGRFAAWQLDLVARTRFFVNHRVEAELFRGNFLADAERAFLADVRDVGSGASNLARATEAVYHELRVRGWVSAEYGTSSLRRHVLAPFFHPRYLAWARAVRPHLKQGASVFAEMLARLDPELAAVPINGGLTAFEIARTDPAMRARKTGRTVQKLGRKVAQKAQRREKSPVSARDLAPAVLESWAARPGALDALAAVDALDQRVLEDLSSGRRTSTSGTVALLVNLRSALEFVAAVPDD